MLVYICVFARGVFVLRLYWEGVWRLGVSVCVDVEQELGEYDCVPVLSVGVWRLGIMVCVGVD